MRSEGTEEQGDDNDEEQGTWNEESIIQDAPGSCSLFSYTQRQWHQSSS
jgi:hypothetical protein